MKFIAINMNNFEDVDESGKEEIYVYKFLSINNTNTADNMESDVFKPLLHAI